jgi:2-polyprenyl-3-methyl-5-hydroxy-6-metoxy-1,4-benzoquinol methylase
MDRKGERNEQWDFDGYWDNPRRVAEQEEHNFNRLCFGAVPKPKPGKNRLLDLGSAWGVFAERLSGAGYDVTASDLDERSLKMIRDRGLKAVRLDVVEEKFPFADGEFDVVTCCELIEHIKHPANMLGEIGRVLKPDGILVISTPNICWWYLRLKHLIGRWDMQDPDHIRFYTPASLEKMLGEFGFEVVGRKAQFVSPHVHIFGIKIPPEPLRTFEQPILHSLSYDFALTCGKKGGMI